MGARVLLVDGDGPSLQAEASWLESADYETTPLSSFEEARAALDGGPYDVLIADIRLGAFNGIHLTLLAKHRNPRVHTVVTHNDANDALRTDALRAGAERFLVKPFSREGFLQVVDRLVRAAESAEIPERRWPRVRLHKSRDAWMDQGEARVLDVSYGGVRVEVPASPPGELGTRVRLQLVEPTLSIYVRPVWLQPSAPGRFACGAEILDQDPDSSGRWRSFVDAMSAA